MRGLEGKGDYSERRKGKGQSEPKKQKKNKETQGHRMR